MGATDKSRGVEYGPAELLAISREANKAAAMIGESVRLSLLAAYKKATDAFLAGTPFEVALLQTKTFAQFLALNEPTQGLFNQLASEMPFWTLLDQIEETCFLQPDNLAIASPFLGELWANEVADDPFKTRKGWGYLPVPEAVEAFRKLFGSSLKADHTLKLAAQARPRSDSEGVPTWIKLTTLARLLDVRGNPLDVTDEGRQAYADTVDWFILAVGKAFVAAYPKFGVNNWRKGALTSKHVVVTPAGIVTWKMLEAKTDDDFCFSSAGANTGSLYAGHSTRRSRLGIVRAGNQMPQDCVMVGGTIATQPDRLTRFEDLGIDCTGNAYSPDADGAFRYGLCWGFGGGRLSFGVRCAGGADQYWGGASVFAS